MPSFCHLVDALLHADGVPGLERAEVPAEAPAHAAVDVDDVVGDLADAVRRVGQRRVGDAARELGGACRRRRAPCGCARRRRRRPWRRRPRRTWPSAAGDTRSVLKSSVTMPSGVFFMKPPPVLSPSIFFSTICSSSAGTLKSSRRSSLRQGLVAVLARRGRWCRGRRRRRCGTRPTWGGRAARRRSRRPPRRCSRRRCASLMRCIMANTPMRLATKLGVSLP